MTGRKSSAIAIVQGERPLWGTEVFSKLLDSCVEALFHQLGAPVQHVDECHTDTSFEQSAIIGFDSKLVQGTVTLVVSRSLLISSHPSSRHSETWIGELANLIIGRLKNDFWHYGVEDLQLGIPRVVASPCSPPSPSALAAVTHRSYSNGTGGLLCVWATGTICTEVVKQTGSAASMPSLVQPGKLVLF